MQPFNPLGHSFPSLFLTYCSAVTRPTVGLLLEAKGSIIQWQSLCYFIAILTWSSKRASWGVYILMECSKDLLLTKFWFLYNASTHLLFRSCNPHFCQTQYAYKFKSTSSEILRQHTPPHDFLVEQEHGASSSPNWWDLFLKKAFHGSWENDFLLENLWGSGLFYIGG